VWLDQAFPVTEWLPERGGKKLIEEFEKKDWPAQRWQTNTAPARDHSRKLGE